MIRQNKPYNFIMYYLNDIVNKLYVYGSITTTIINTLYNAMHLIQTKQSKKLIYIQINTAIQLLHTL
jgi:ATP-dependent protease ClpP protease subunit